MASDITSRRTRGLAVGVIVVYVMDERKKIVGVGKVLSLNDPPTEATLHVYVPDADHRFQTSWAPEMSRSLAAAIAISGGEEGIASPEVLAPFNKWVGFSFCVNL